MASIMRAHPWTLELVGKDEWAGVGAFLTYAANAPAYAMKYHNRRIHTGVSGPKAPLVRSVRIHYSPEGMEGMALLLMRAETPREPGKAKVTTKIIGLPHTESVDLDGKTMSGPDLHSNNGGPDGIHTWKAVRGSATSQLAIEQITVSTAYHAGKFSRSKLAALYGHVNSKAMRKLGQAKYTLWLRGAEWGYEFGDTLVYVDYIFWGTTGTRPAEYGSKKMIPLTWHDVVKSQKGLWLVTRQPEFEYNARTKKYTMVPGSDTKGAGVNVWVPMERWGSPDADGHTEWYVDPVPPESRYVLPEADLTTLDSMIQWPKD